MNYETTCEPVPGAEVDGFNFFRDQNGMIVARCCWCMIGFDVTAKNVATIRPMMIIHLELVHGCVRRASTRQDYIFRSPGQGASRPAAGSARRFPVGHEAR